MNNLKNTRSEELIASGSERTSFFEKIKKIFNPLKEYTPTRLVPVALEPPAVSEKADLLYHFAKSAALPLRQEETDALTMKMIRKLQELGIPLRPIVEQLRNLPVMAVNEQANVVALSQYITPLPGVSFELKARFKRDAVRSAPLTFCVIDKPCSKPHFPHAIQHTGWALASVCLSAMPHRPDKMARWSALHKRRTDHGNQLSYQDQLAQLLLKKQQFYANNQLYLDMHKRLRLAMVPEAKKTIDHFFERLKELPHVYEYLSETSQAVSEAFIKKPYQQIVRARFNQEIPPGNRMHVANFLEECALEIENDLKLRIQEAGSALERTTLQYILEVGRGLKKGVHPIIVQEMSEALHFTAPLLDTFSRQLQAAAFKQAAAFIENKPLSEELKSDLTLFEDNALQEWEPYVNELESYYASRKIAS